MQGLRRGLRLVSTDLEKKPQEYIQAEYLCEWCDLVTEAETIYHRKKKLFLCDKCTIETDEGEI